MKTQTRRQRHILSSLLTQLVVSQVEWRDDEELFVSLVVVPTTSKAAMKSTVWEVIAGSTTKALIDGFFDDDLFAFTKEVKGVMVVDSHNRRWSWHVLASRGGFFTRDESSGHVVSAFMAFKAVVRGGLNIAQIWPNPFGVGLSLGAEGEIIIGQQQALVSSAEGEGC